ncbi:MAG: argininosuccinate synthase, partial [Dehalococcoidia bacterium]|nr:argininosuccinate synthase [Dehalococcoidia bacterium]
GFDKGIPVSVDGVAMEPVALVQALHAIAGENGVGRVDHVENRLVGIKSREIYEAPAATVLLKAHAALQNLVMAKDQLRFKALVAANYADLIYNGLWFGGLRRNLAAYVNSTQEYVTGEVRVKLFKGTCTVVGRKSPYSLYDLGLATYDTGDTFDQADAPGFIRLWGLPSRLQAKIQDVTSGEE